MEDNQFLRITNMIKLLRVYGGCLGAKCRRRTWDTAISLGEPCTGVISENFRMGKPAAANPQHLLSEKIGFEKVTWGTETS